MFGLKGESWKLCPKDGAETRDGKFISNRVIPVSRLDEAWESGMEPKSVREIRGERGNRGQLGGSVDESGIITCSRWKALSAGTLA